MNVQFQRSFVAVLLIVHGLLIAWVSYRNSPTFDEVAHLPSGIHHWTTGTFDLYRVNPPLVRMVAALPAVWIRAETDWTSVFDDPYQRAEWFVGDDFLAANGSNSFWIFTLSRWACIPFSLLGGFICWRWAKALYGPESGILALSMWCICPEVIGWGSTINPDLGAASVGLAAIYSFWCWTCRPNARRAFAAGILLGLALLTKMTWVILFGIYPFLFLLSVISRKVISSRQAYFQMSLILVVGLYTLNLGYGFEGSCQRLGSFRFVSQTLGGPDAHNIPGNRLANTWIATIPIPVPENYVRGIDVQKSDFERKKWSYLRGEQRFGGWWWYYLYGLLVKLPLGMWLIFSIVVVLTFRRCKEYQVQWIDELFVLIPAISLLVLVSSQTGFNRYLRYVLPAIPYFVIWISKSGKAFALKHMYISKVCLIGIAWMSVSSLWAYPHSLSYFNELAGGPRGGHEHLVDANIDWGQDLLNLKRWLDKHPEASQIRVAYFGFMDIRHAGLEVESPWPLPTDLAVHDPQNIGPHSGWFAVSVNHLQGYRHFDTDQPVYEYFQHFKPTALAGYSIYIYYITPAEANRVRSKLGLPNLKTRGEP